MENIYNHKQCFSYTTNTLTHVSLSIAYSRRSDCGEGTNRREQEKQGGPGWGREWKWRMVPSPLSLSCFLLFPAVWLRATFPHLNVARKINSTSRYSDKLVSTTSRITEISLQNLQRVTNRTARLTCSPAGSRPWGSRGHPYSEILIIRGVGLMGLLVEN